ncbi:MAG: hypothetical protein AAB592_01210 [Patescibacteria group bacterium]
MKLGLKEIGVAVGLAVTAGGCEERFAEPSTTTQDIIAECRADAERARQGFQNINFGAAPVLDRLEANANTKEYRECLEGHGLVTPRPVFKPIGRTQGSYSVDGPLDLGIPPNARVNVLD